MPPALSTASAVGELEGRRVTNALNAFVLALNTATVPLELAT
jgi:hypothetical protein